MSTGPGAAAARVTARVDWARDDHAICVAGGQGEALEHFTVRHDAAGLKPGWSPGCCGPACRRPVSSAGGGPVAGTPLQAGLTVFVIAPSQVKNLRSRYGPAGNKDDRFDAYVLADVVRTDARRLRPTERDSDQVGAMRSTVRVRRDLAGHRVAAASQLRGRRQIVFPAAVALSAGIDSATTLAFLSRFTTQEQADWLSSARLKSVSCSGKTGPAVLHARLLAAPPRPGQRPDPRRQPHPQVHVLFAGAPRVPVASRHAIEYDIGL